VDCTIEWLNGTSGLEVRPLRALSFSEGYALEVVGQDPAGNALGPMRTYVLTGAAPPPPGLVVQDGGVPLALLVVLLVGATAAVALAASRGRKGDRGERAASNPRQPPPPGRPMGKV